jgi:peptide/nickel transport system permease protein
VAVTDSQRGRALRRAAPRSTPRTPRIAIFPGLAIALTVFGFSLFGDSLRDALDPNLRDR